MNYLFQPGRALYSIAILAFGLLHFAFGHTLMGMLPLPATGSGLVCWTYLDGAVLTLAGGCLLLRIKPLWAARLAGVWLLLLYLGIFLRGEITHSYDPAVWTGAFEVLALGGGAFVWADTARDGWGKYLYAAALIVFAIQHFQYAVFISGLIPAWIPARLFWAYAVGVLFLLSAASIAFRLQVRVVCTLLGIMFLLWVLILHTPRVAGSPHTETEWTSLFVALGMGGVAWMLASRGRTSPGDPS